MSEPLSDLYGRPPWAVRIRQDRTSRGWTVAEAAENLLRHARARGDRNEKDLPSKSTVVRRWRGWEAGEHNPDTSSDDYYAPLIAQTLGTTRYALFPPAPREVLGGDLVVPSEMETAEILARMQASDVDRVTLEGITRTVEILCSEYPYMPSDQLVAEGRSWLRRVVALRGHRLTLDQHRELLVQAGWLALLVGCVENDMGRRNAAESTRRMAESLGKESKNADILGWAHEMTCWFRLTDHDYKGVIAAAEAGLEVAGHQSVAVQLLAQAAKAHARLGNRREMEKALERAGRILDALPYPTNLDNHFNVDPSKIDYYALDCWRILGVYPVAARYADEVIRTSTAYDGTERKPMRIAEARLTLGVIAAYQGDVDEAAQMGQRALSGDRRSLPSLLLVANELGTIMSARYGKTPEARNYLEQLHELSRSA
ncbi:tetratricopeptide repeat protein [Amycolatopsis sp. NPDC058986]|uniref:tetratricopeptide repeat protein n=1 Tax=unclassified Amycolatopsis TaxID=2618356 RepID=UPI003670DF9A